MSDNLRLWNKLETTDPQYTKEFNRGSWKATAINATYVAKNLTSLFGPCGIGWRLVVDREYFVDGHLLGDGKSQAKVHVVVAHLDYIVDGKAGDWASTGQQCGQTTMVGENSRGTFTDEEAPKKSYTDCLTKCAALIGQSADIFSGNWDANKYVNTPAVGSTTPAVPANPAPTQPTSTACITRLPRGCKNKSLAELIELTRTVQFDALTLTRLLKQARENRGTDIGNWIDFCGAVSTAWGTLPADGDKDALTAELAAESEFVSGWKASQTG